jgi:kynurenine formamidase
MKRASVAPDESAGYATDYIGMQYHSATCTHIDALCHVWGERGWNDRDPSDFITADGSSWAGIEHLREGVFTRGWLIDVPAYRGTEYVTMASPVTGHELERIVEAHGLRPEPGDAIVIRCGRAAYERDFGPYGGEVRPGLHASCLGFLRDIDCSLLVWDMMDMAPFGVDIPWSVHGALFSFGLPIVDNAALEELSTVCTEEQRNQFLLVVAPLNVVGGTGSPVNPLAVF